jgi:hypothetical protein
MTYGTVSADAIKSSNGSTMSPASSMGFKNRIINGAMVIDQRNAGAASANTINGYFLDRWQILQSVTGKLIAQQNAGSVTAPTGLPYYLGVTSQSAYSVGANDYYLISQYIEGLNTADLAWGTASAATVTVSFWVRSSLTGTFGVSVCNYNSTSNYVATYTVNSANTWEQKTITIAGPTSGGWNINNSIGLQLRFCLGAGSTFQGTAGSWSGSNLLTTSAQTSVVGTNGATFYITGVQLEVGSTATSFDYRPYGTELALCQRYYFSSGGTHEYLAFLDGNLADYPSLQPLTWPVTMRSTPSVNTFTFGAVGYNSGSAGASFTPSGGTVVYYGNGQCGYIAINAISNYQGAAQTSKVGYWGGISFGLTSEL